MTIVIFIVILAILILSHEFGHFIVAKRAGVRVDEFGLGFPPRLFGWKKGETIYSINIIPFGGFVKIFGENPDEESISGPDRERSLIAKPKWVQALVLVAGVTFNLILAWLVISLGFIIGLPTPADQIVASDHASHVQLVITSVLPDSPAEQSGLKTGDAISQLELATNSQVRAVSPLTPEIVQKFITDHSNDELRLFYNRGKIFDESKQSSVSPVTFVKIKPIAGLIENKAAIGISMDNIAMVQKSFFPAVWEGLKLTIDLTYLTAKTIVSFVIGAFQGESGLSAVTGPVGLVGLVGDARLMGFVYILSFMALISINLAVINLVPFPALDGGRLLFLLIEKIKGSEIKPVIANTLNLVGFGFLLLLMAVVTYSDIVKLFFK
jgi:regulator of sigma E protease